jgi:adsorption protein B
MVQVPVLPLATPVSKWVHGVYCDDFAESQFKDLPARVFAGGFMPSCGVGTGLSRWTVEQLAATYSNRVFEPACLTEDYELGLRVYQMGLKQIFTEPIVSTREFFPQTFQGAVRQRTRWITGISLQCWQRNGWGKSWREAYWLWRDRKCLVGNPLSIVANVVFIYGFTTWVWSQISGSPWVLGAGAVNLAWIGLAMQCFRAGVRTACCSRFYGLGFAAAAPLRVFVANVINALATIRAIKRFAVSIITRTPLVWLKTAHSFPSEAALNEVMPLEPIEEEVAVATAAAPKTRAAGAP